MMDLVPRVKQHFDALEEQLTVFCDFEFQGEAWFKTELLMAFNQMRKAGLIEQLDREVALGSQKVDITVRHHGVLHWIELKNWLIGKQKGTWYWPNFYFGDPSSVGITPDVKKLSPIPAPDGRWLFLLLTANPGAARWEAGLEKFHGKFPPYQLEPRTHPDQFPPHYFLAVLELAGTHL